MGFALKTGSSARRVLTVGIVTSAMLGGCAYLRGPVPASTPPPSPQRLTAVPTPTPSQVAPPKRHRVASRTTSTLRTPASGATKSGGAPETVPAASATPRTAPAVTLAGAAPDPASSQMLLDEAGHRIRKLDRAKLNPNEAAVYDQVTDLVNAGHDALNRHDALA